MVLVYWTVLILTLPLLFFFKLKNSKKKGNQKYLNFLIYVYTIFVLTFFAGFRDIASITLDELRFNDEFRYRSYFNSLIGTEFSLMNIQSFEWGRYILDWSLANTFKDSQVWIFVYAFLTNIIFLKSIKKYIQPLWLGVFIYIALGMYIFQMNGTTQMLAAAVLTLSIKYIVNNNLLKFVTIVLLAASIHVSALLFLPVFFLKNINITYKNLVVAVFIGLAIMINFDTVANLILQFTPYENYINKINNESYGVNFFRVLLFIIFYLFIIHHMKKIKKISEIDILFTNMIMVLIVTAIISLSYVHVARIDIYFQFGIIYLLPRIFNDVKDRWIRLSVLIILLFLSVFGFQQSLNIPYQNVIIEFFVNILI